MKLDISELVMVANKACRKINNLSANAGNIDLEAIKSQNELLEYSYIAIGEWIKQQK
ncbi:hypothetical protein UFOVP11_6 [uncultured Caudovirales phage]|uniref:Uncharacterized protein n=1 Tax=uncultured Caudovirales phage TaxID=2100421 RepID=A0A6J5KKD9_9CAUD|nr:hypothetical protein UFOVP11_6 [uncultured Caudovirales phage]